MTADDDDAIAADNELGVNMTSYPKNSAQQQLLITLLWSESDDDGNSLDCKYETKDIDPVCVRDLCCQWEEFRENYHVFWYEECDDEQAAHDFILTRNGHGTGFWDRGLLHGDRLSEASKRYGCVNLYVDDGVLYTAG